MEKKMLFAMMDSRDRMALVETPDCVNENNVSVCAEAEKEYLQRLKELQDDIVAKYGPRLTYWHDFEYHSREHADLIDKYAMPYTERKKYRDLYYT